MPADSSTHPYSSLTPDVVLNALEAQGLRCDGRLLALNSYENRVYQVGIEDMPPAAVRRRQVLPARAMERRADPRGARVLARAGGRGDSRRRSDGLRRQNPHA